MAYPSLCFAAVKLSLILTWAIRQNMIYCIDAYNLTSPPSAWILIFGIVDVTKLSDLTKIKINIVYMHTLIYCHLSLTKQSLKFKKINNNILLSFNLKSNH